MVSRVEEHLLQLRQNELAHLTEELHVHPGAEGFKKDSLGSSNQDQIINPDDDTEDVKFPTPTVGGLEGLNTEQEPIQTPNMIAPNRGANDPEVWQQANWNPYGSVQEDGDAYQRYRRPQDIPGELPDKYQGPVFGVDEESGQTFFDFVQKLQKGGEKFEIADFTRQEADALERIFPGTLDKMNKFRKDKYGLPPIKIIDRPQLPLV